LSLQIKKCNQMKVVEKSDEQEHRQWGRYAVANEIPLRLSMDSNWTLLYICIS